MVMNGEASANAYGVIVVGAGIGGLTVGALLAKAGKSVLVAEQEDRPGGYARAVERDPYTFDTAVHLMMGGAHDDRLGPGLVDAVLSHLGVRDRCEFFRSQPFYRVQFPEFQLDVPTGREAFIEAHLQHFPGEDRGLRDLAELCVRIYRQTVGFPIAPKLWDWLRTPVRYADLFRYSDATLGPVVDQHLTDPQLRAVYCTLWPYLALPPSRASFLYWGGMMGAYIEQGAFYCRGGFQRLADALAEALEKQGGELVLGSRVTGIRAESRRVRGAILENGQAIDAPIVISNADARDTFGEPLEGEQVPGSYLRKLECLEPSVSALMLYLATDLDVRGLGVPNETMCYASWDHEHVFYGGTPGRLLGLNVTVPSLMDDSLAPPGEHVVLLTSSLPPTMGDPSPEERAQFAETMLDAAERVLPGLRDHITFVEGAPGVASGALLPRHLGPVYGWAGSPQQAGSRRLANTTPISGLYLVGQWTQPGYGVWTVAASGVKVARLVLGVQTSAGLIPLHL